MTQAYIRNALRDRFNTTVVVPYLNTTPVVYDNAPRPVPDTVPPSVTSWVRFSVLTGDVTQATVGGTGQRIFRTIGMAQVDLFYGLDEGEEFMLLAADLCIAQFRGISIGPPSITFTPAPSLSAGTRDGPWWKRSVTIPFRADEFA
jgi:hypothetical protein